MRIFSYDSKFSQILLRLSYGCYLNLLWFVCSLPVFTLGAATAALYDVTLRMARGEEPGLNRRFFQAFRENFRQATTLWLILLGVGALLGLDGYILYHLYKSTAGAAAIICTLGLALVIVAAICLVIVLLYIFPLVARVKNTNFAMVKNSFLIGIRYLFCTILAFAIHFAMFFAVVALYTPLIIFGEGLCALVSSYLLDKVISACSGEPGEEAGEAQ